MRVRFRLAGSDDTTANYYGSAGIMTWGGVLAAGGSSAAATSSFLFQLSTFFNSASLDVITKTRPLVTGLAMSAGPEDRGSFFSALLNVTAAFDSATFFPSAGTITGSVSVYGYNK